MSVVGLLDSVIALCRHNEGSADGYGDVATVPTLVKNIKASLQSTRMHGFSRDQGAGAQPTSSMLLFYLKKDDVRLGDTIFVRKGPLAGTWWTVGDPIGVTRGAHREVMLKPYVANKPDV